jgi:hypothetical protein
MGIRQTRLSGQFGRVCCPFAQVIEVGGDVPQPVTTSWGFFCVNQGDSNAPQLFSPSSSFPKRSRKFAVIKCTIPMERTLLG